MHHICSLNNQPSAYNPTYIIAVADLPIHSSGIAGNSLVK